MTEQFRYAAFISYSSKDAKFAQRLHRALEGYGIPSSVGKFDLIGGGKQNRIYPVFRDREELSAGHLGHQIEANLKASAALIVVCSPNGAASPWVQKEIEFFAAQGRHAKIFAIIPDTAPILDENDGDATQSCFPPAFRGDALDGDKLEPLAADARKGKDGFRNAWLKIVAGMIGGSPGQLIDRDRQRAKSNRRVALAAVGALCVLLAITAVAIDLQAWRTGLTASARSLSEQNNAYGAMTFAVAATPEVGSILTVADPNSRRLLATAIATGVVDSIGPVDSLFALSTDGRYLITTTQALNGPRIGLSFMTLHDLHERDETDLGGMETATFSHDGRYLVLQGGETRAVLLDLETQQETDLGYVAPTEYLFRNTVTGSTFSPDDRFFLSMDAETRQGIPGFFIYDAVLRDLRTLVATPLGRLRAYTFSPDGRFLLLQDQTLQGTLRDMETGEITELGFLHRWAFSADGRLLAISDGETMSVRNCASGEVLPLGAISLSQLGVSPDGRFVVTGDGDQSAVRDLETGGETRLPGLTSFQFSRSGRHLVTARNRSGVLLDLVTGARLDMPGLRSFTLSPDSRFLVTVAEEFGVVRDLSDGREEQITLPAELGISGDGRFLVTRTEEDVGILREFSTGRETPLGSVSEFLISGDSNWLVALRADRSVSFRTFAAYRAADGVDSQTEDGEVRLAACGSNVIGPRPFAAADRTRQDAESPAMNTSLRGRPWNPCDWRGLLAIFPNASRGDGWFEGARQWVRFVHVRLGGPDYVCEETTFGATTETRARRRSMCERAAQLNEETL